MLEGLFWFTAIVGVGVTVVDLLGLISSGGDAGQTDGTHDDSSHPAGDGQVRLDDVGIGGGAPVLSFLRYVRTAIYFCLGFGPFGIASSAFGVGPVGSLVWSLGGGALVSLLARLVFRFQRTTLDSSIQEEDLLYEEANVIAPIADGGMGKVRIRLGQSVSERYALAEDPADHFAVDALVRVSQVTDSCVYVRRLNDSKELE